MNKIVTRGFGKKATRSGIITQGYGGFFEQLIELGRTAVIKGKSTARKIKKEIDEIIVRVTLLSVNDKFLDITGAERSTPNQDFSNPTVLVKYYGKRLIELIRLSIKRLK